ncbi:Cthe_2314 family HEPN domain-containing protein [Chryseobacterium sp.]|uniref:Cthe_2314 family HEPN domain-containing protein n=1 Tax=Chryseobacterium sp. TaxID=1871047 RepID=UPI00289C9792|nr:Cthe_2314 family HEPN domain-containing protein [Chryseobacterium sp.]
MKKPIEQFSLENETFIKSLLKKSSKLYLTKSNRIRKKISSKDSYQKDILEVCLRLHSTINTLSFSRLFLEENKIFLNDASLLLINKSDYFRYHIECFFIRVTTYKDLIFKLINKTYDFQINDNIGLEKNIKKEIKAKNIIELTELLTGLDIIMNKIKPIRNELAHGNYLEDLDLTLLQSMETTKRNNSKEYEDSVKSFLFNSSVSMYGIELMLVTYLKLVYKKLLKKRREIEKQKLRLTQVLQNAGFSR